MQSPHKNDIKPSKKSTKTKTQIQIYIYIYKLINTMQQPHEKTHTTRLKKYKDTYKHIQHIYIKQTLCNNNL